MSAYHNNVKQELPPPGGYNEIFYRRVPAQRIIGYKSFFIVSSMLTGYAFYYYAQRKKHIAVKNAEYLNHVLAVEPLVKAEVDRAFLRQLRHNRNVERDLMKDVPDWEVGTLWGEPLFKTVPENALPPLHLSEFYAHRGLHEHKEHAGPYRSVNVGADPAFLRV